MLLSDRQLNQSGKGTVWRITLKRQNVSLEDLLGQSLELFHSQFLAKDITVKQTPPNGHMETGNIMADPDKLTQVLHNLLQNAWQYTPPGGTVTVGLEPQQTHVKISITNTGEGIAQDDLPYIFERFYRAEKSRSREHGGEGIGLAIVKELVEAHGGMVGAHSSQEQTCVWFTVPT